ncbi:MAG TPA: SDR family oxidoreductase [Acidimicrobiales bacterium]|jgi:NAD(P)-dependent dehydrogenase (short-subunit alcohol dehydrogenase family)|nr:SDR family oxidoreductase [Acidimicrobiales bacterium]
MANKIAIVTGCSSGIGRATALELTARGYEVVATARRPESIADLAVARTLALDVDSDESVTAAQAAVGTVDVLVNNAGFGIDGPVEEVPLAEARRAFETNFFGAARMIQAFVPAMRERGSGAIVNVTSISGVVGSPLAGFYAATKFALEALSESLHIEVGHFGVRVLVVEPGSIATNFGDNMVDLRGRPGPYAELATKWEIAMGVLGGEAPAPGPELVATKICDALEEERGPLRLPVGADAEMIVAARQGASYDDFEAAMRGFLKVDW